MSGRDEEALKAILDQDLLDTQDGLVCASETERMTNYVVVVPSRESANMFNVFHVVHGKNRLVAASIDSVNAAVDKGYHFSDRVVLDTHCVFCEALAGEYYMVRDNVWQEAGLGRGRIHLVCLEEQLGRELTMDDFDFRLPVNEGLRFSYEMGLKAGDRLYDTLAALHRIHQGMEEGEPHALIEQAMREWDKEYGNGRWQG